MRVFSFSFIVYLVLLLTQPCHEAFGYVDRSDASNASATAIDEPTHPETATDDCSPLCVCGCCGLSTASVVVTDAVSAHSLGITPSSLTPSYKDPHTKSYKDTIWQPPKV